MHPPTVQPLPLKSGALQGAVVIEYPFDHRFGSLHIMYDGVNGQLPNLDLFNTAISVGGGQMGIRTSLQEMWDHTDSYEERLETILRGMVRQGFGYATGAHSSFMPYRVDAITLQAKGEGWQDEMALGRTVEGVLRSLNNLLEHLHQSFFLYLLMQTNRFVSIGTYLPSAMLIAANFTIMAIALWMRTGHYEPNESEDKNMAANSTGMVERKLALPLTLVVGLHLLGLVPLYIFNTLSYKHFTIAIHAFVAVDFVLPIVLATLLIRLLTKSPKQQRQQFLLIKSFSLLLLGLLLSTLAILNFSLSFIVGLLCSPLSFVSPTLSSGIKSPIRQALSVLGLLGLNAISPPAVVLAACQYFDVEVEEVLIRAAFGWHVWGMWTQVIVWCVWWPAWLIGGVIVSSLLFS